MAASAGPYSTPTHHAKGARPTGVTVLAVLAAIGGVFALFAALGMLAGGALIGATGEAGIGGLAMLVGVFMLAYGVFGLVAAYGLWKGLRWAWYLTLVFAGIGAVMALFTLFSGEIFSALLSLAINGVIVWYLLSPEVQGFFGVNHNAPWKYKGRPA